MKIDFLLLKVMRIELSRKATHCIWVFVFVFDTVCLYVCFTFFPQDWISKKSHFKWPICMWGSNGMKIGNKWEKKITDRRKKRKKEWYNGWLFKQEFWNEKWRKFHLMNLNSHSVKLLFASVKTFTKMSGPLCWNFVFKDSNDSRKIDGI